MIFKICKKIDSPLHLSEDSVFDLIDYYFSNNYRIERVLSPSGIKFKRINNFKSNGWEMIQKQLKPTDDGFIRLQKNKLIIYLILDKIFFASLLGFISLNLIIWKGFNFELYYTLIFTLTIVAISWAIMILKGFSFLERTSNDLKKILT